MGLDQSKRNRALESAGGCAVLVVIVLLVATCMGGETKPAESVKASSVHVTSVSVANDHVEISLDLPKTMNASDLPIEAGSDVEAIAKTIVAGASDVPQTARTISLIFRAPVIDRYGNTSVDKWSQMDFEISEFRKINFKNVAGAMMLDFARDVSFSARWGREAAMDYCREHADLSPAYCREVAGGNS